VYSREGEDGGVERVLHEFQLAREVILCPLLNRAYVVVSDDAVPVAEKLAPNATARCGWAIKVMTQQSLDVGIEQATTLLRELEGVDLCLARRLAGEGVLSYLDLARIEPVKIAELAEIPLHQAEDLVRKAKESADGTQHKANQPQPQSGSPLGGSGPKGIVE
jgi:hypothetical protein